jgi:hypothetical protein
MEVYNKNRDNNNSMHDEIREQNAKLKNAPLKKKWEYFREYYLKMTLLILAGVILLISLAYSIISAPKETAFAAFFINSGSYDSTSTLDEEFANYMGINTKKAECYIDSSMYFASDFSDYDSYLNVQKVMAIIASKTLDVMVGDEDSMSYFAQSECFGDVTEILPEDLLEQFEDKLYYAKVGDDEVVTPIGIYITDAPKIMENDYYIGMEPIMCFVVNSDNTDNAIEFLRYIYLEDE